MRPFAAFVIFDGSRFCVEVPRFDTCRTSFEPDRPEGVSFELTFPYLRLESRVSETVLNHVRAHQIRVDDMPPHLAVSPTTRTQRLTGTPSAGPAPGAVHSRVEAADDAVLVPDVVQRREQSPVRPGELLIEFVHAGDQLLVVGGDPVVLLFQPADLAVLRLIRCGALRPARCAASRACHHRPSAPSAPGSLAPTDDTSTPKAGPPTRMTSSHSSGGIPVGVIRVHRYPALGCSAYPIAAAPVQSPTPMCISAERNVPVRGSVVQPIPDAGFGGQ